MKTNDNQNYYINFDILNDCEIKELIDYCFGMPDYVIRYIKFNFDKLIESYNQSKITINVNSPFIKYFNRNKLDIQKNINSKSMCQHHYSVILYNIDNFCRKNHTDNILNFKLKNILNMMCYNESTMLNVEKAITSLLSEYNNTDLLYELTLFISTQIMPYKYHVFKLFTNLIIKLEINDGFLNNNLLSNLNKNIILLISNKLNYSETHDLSIMIYAYLKFLGFNDYLLNEFKSNDNISTSILYRFYILINHINPSSVWNDIYEDISSYLYNNYQITEVMSRLVNIEKYNFSDNDNKNIIINNDNNILKIGRYVLLMNDNSDIKLNEDLFIYHIIRVLNSSELKQYIGDDYNKIDFNLSDDDCTRLMKQDDMINFGTIFNIDDSSIKYIGNYDNNWFIFFKKDNKSICGISIIPNKQNDRFIFELLKDKTFYYKYISDF